MSPDHAQSTELTAHPTTRNHAVRNLSACVRSVDPGILEFEYSLHADLARLRIPESDSSGRTDGLWKHTCFEAFVGAADAAAYHEFNFSPSRQWAIYRFSAHRTGMAPADTGRAPEIAVYRDGDGLELKAAVRLEHLGELRDAARLKVALAAVIEEIDGSLSYWGLRHAPGAPDFHHPFAFALEVTPSL